MEIQEINDLLSKENRDELLKKLKKNDLLDILEALLQDKEDLESVKSQLQDSLQTNIDTERENQALFKSYSEIHSLYRTVPVGVIIIMIIIFIFILLFQ